MQLRLILTAVFLTLALGPTRIHAQAYIPGNTYFDSTGYVEYRAGNLPIIISAPHGGSLEPTTIPDRSCTGCVYIKDAWTQPIAEGLFDAFFEQTGCYPHVIINLLHRKKFDANRDIGDAADGDPTVEQAWYGYHDFIEAAKSTVVANHGRGLFLDIHGHGHAIQRVELGYLLSDTELQLPDSNLNLTSLIEESSIRALVGNNLQGASHADLLRGPDSYGTMLNDVGFPSVPSLSIPFPAPGDPYFDGGYNTQRHGSRDNNGDIDAIQLELNQDIRFDSASRETLIDSMAAITNRFIDHYYNDQYWGNFCNTPSNAGQADPAHRFSLYPNPARDRIYVQSDLEAFDVEVHNPLGQRLYAGPWTAEGIPVDLFPDGLYIVKMSHENQLLRTMRFVKE